MRFFLGRGQLFLYILDYSEISSELSTISSRISIFILISLILNISVIAMILLVV